MFAELVSLAIQDATFARPMLKGDLDVFLAFIFSKFTFVVIFFASGEPTNFLSSFLAVSWALTHGLAINHCTRIILRAGQRLASSWLTVSWFHRGFNNNTVLSYNTR